MKPFAQDLGKFDLISALVDFSSTPHADAICVVIAAGYKSPISLGFAMGRADGFGHPIQEELTIVLGEVPGAANVDLAAGAQQDVLNLELVKLVLDQEQPGVDVGIEKRGVPASVGLEVGFLGVRRTALVQD